MSKHRVRSPGQNTPETHPSRSTTLTKSVPWAAGMASKSFVLLPLAASIVRFDCRTNKPIPTACLSRRIRIYSTKTFKSLGTLDYHKNGVQALTFARNDPSPSRPPKNHSGEDGVEPRAGTTSAVVGEDGVGDDDDDEEFGGTEIEARKRWLVAGGKDGRISVWELMDFTKPKP